MSEQGLVSNLLFTELEVGKKIKSSKKKYIWEFYLDRRYFQVELRDSKISRKKEILLNGKVIYPKKSFNGTFSYSFQVDNDLIISFLQMGGSFELRVNNESFTHLAKLDKQRKEFYIPTKKEKVVVMVKEEVPEEKVEETATKTLYNFSTAQPEFRESFNCQNRVNTSRKLEDLYNKNFNKVQRSGTSLLNSEEKPTGVFPLRENVEEEIGFKKSNSIIVESDSKNVNSINQLFDQLDLNLCEQKPVNKVDEVKRLYQRTFSDNTLTTSQNFFQQNENKTREDNFYRSFLMNPNGSNMNNWQFNKDSFQNSPVNFDNCSKTVNHRMSSLSMNSASTNEEEGSSRKNSSFKYPDFSDIDHKKLAPNNKTSKSQFELMEFSPSERVSTCPKTNEQQSFNDVVAQLFN